MKDFDLEKKIFTMSLWKLYFILFPSFTLLVFILGLILDFISGEIDMVKLVEFSLFFGAFTSMIPIPLIGLARTGNEFHVSADEVEEMIKNADDKDLVIEKLLELDKLSFHRTTGQRVHELGKMAEVKYNIKILK